MSLTKCLNSSDINLTEEDVEQIKKAAGDAQLYDGQSAELAGRAAANDFLRELMADRADLVARIEEKGGVVPSRTDAESLTEKGTVMADPAAQKIEDFGEKIGGARKDIDRLQNALSDSIDVGSVPLSKSFPKPNYEKLAEAGVSKQVLVTIAQLRSMIPRKATRGLSRWTEGVESIRNVVSLLLSSGDNLAAVTGFYVTTPGFPRVPMDSNLELARMEMLRDLAVDVAPGQIERLADFRVEDNFYQLFKGEKNVRKFRVVDSANRRVNHPYFDSEADAVAYVKDKVTTEAPVDKKGNRRTKFDLWKERGKEGVFLGKKVGTNKYIELKNFPTSKEARQYLADNQEELEKLLEDKKKIGSMRRAEQNPRVGLDYRQGQNVTPDKFAETFGFRGVEFGNYVENDRRQQDLNNAYDGLLDLAGAIGIDPMALSLNGELGLAFGARGRGGKNAAAAHYEPGSIVINLTKRAGPGSLAHEWFHAMDNYFGKMGGTASFATETKRPTRRFYQDSNTSDALNPADYGIRPEVYDAFRGLVSAIGSTKIAERSGVLDNRRSKDYYGTTIEMAARSFERYIVDKLKADGFESDYLATFLPKDSWDKVEGMLGNQEETYPYPTDEEAETTNPAFQELFDALETKESDRGLELYSKVTDGPAGSGITIEEASAAADEFLSEYEGNIDLEIMVGGKQEDIYGPGNAREVAGVIKGAYHPKLRKLTLAADNLADRADAKRTLRHEVLGHYGLNTFTPEDKRAILDLIKNSRNEESLKEIWETADRVYADRSEDVRAEEVFAKIAETERSELGKVFDDIIALVRKALKAVGLLDKGVVTKSELRSLVESISRGIRAGQRTQQNFPASDQSVIGDSPGTAAYQDAVDKGLDMSEEGRVSRAHMMGFDVDNVLYHGTNSDILRFDISRSGSSSGAVNEPGVFLAKSPAVASSYAQTFNPYEGIPALRSINRISKGAYQKLNEAFLSLLGKSAVPDGGNVIPVYARLSNPYVVDLKGSEYEGGLFSRQIAFASSNGYDGVKFLNVKDPGYEKVDGDLTSDVVVVFSESNIRSVNAAFDPDLTRSDNILEAKESVLDMSKEARMDRAKAMGFDTENVRYRGQHSSADGIESRLGSISFGSREAASTYAESPNNRNDSAVAPKVFPVYLKIQNPVIDNRDDPFMDFGQLSDAIGFESAKKYFIKHRDYIENTGNWEENFSDDFDSVVEVPDDRLPELYIDAFPILDDSDAVAEMRDAGYDGAIHVGNGETSEEVEYKVFGESQIRSVNAAFDPGLADSDNILFSKSEMGSEDDFLRRNRELREEDVTTFTKAKKMLRRQLAPGGLLPGKVFDLKIERDNEIAVVEFDAKHLIGELEAAVRSDYNKGIEELSPNDLETLGRGLRGDFPDHLKEKSKVALMAMRQKIDIQSKQYIELLEEDVAQMSANLDAAEMRILEGLLDAENIYPDSNSPADKGKATKAKNKLIDEAKAEAITMMGDGKKMQSTMKKVEDIAAKMATIQTISNNLGSYVHRSYRAFDDKNWYSKIPDEVFNDARVYLSDGLVEGGMDSKEALDRADVIIDDIVKNGTAYGDFMGMIKESKLGARDLSALRQRKDIHPSIRALLGEYNDPRLNFAKSTTKMGRLIWNSTFLNKMREVGMGDFLFAEGDEPKGTEIIAAEGSEVYAPLNGLYVTREVNQALKDALGKEQMADWYRAIVQANGMVKFGKTVLSPTTSARNWQSAFFFTVANGHFDLGHIGKSVSGFKEYFTNKGDGEKIAYLRKLKQLGVVYDTPYAGEMMRLLDDSKLENWMSGRKGLRGAKDIRDLVTKFYQYGDDFWKIIGFENEKQNLVSVGFSEEDAEVEAAKRIRDTYPTYSMVGKGIQSLRRFPLAGTFVSFPAEIIRTTFNMLRYASEDMKSEKMRPLAIRRMAGLGMAASFAAAAQAVSKAMFDVDDDDEEAVRVQSPTWSKNSNLIFTGRDEDGNLRYIDISFLDPYNYFKRPINAIMRDQPWEDSAVQSMAEMLTPFFGTDIVAGSLFEVFSNKKDSGAPVYKEYDSPWEQTKDIADHLRKALQPGIASNLERTMKALKGEVSPSGRKYNMVDEGLAYIGWRVSTLDPKAAIRYRSYDFADANSQARRIINEVISNPNDIGSNELANAVARSERVTGEAFRQMSKVVESAKTSGMTESEVIAELMAANVSRANISALTRGEVPPIRVTPQSMRAALRRTVTRPDQAAKMRQRYAELRSILADR